ncbi:MAG TPA: hypothetical protein VGU20_21725 [Stellaceae bacterium]|nr:hypothetical protein [Stellaceae bacterium]
MSSAARQTYEASVTSAFTTKKTSIEVAQQTRASAYSAALAAYRGGGSNATYIAAVKAADVAYFAAIDAALAAHHQSVVNASAALVSADGVGPSGWGIN